VATENVNRFFQLLDQSVSILQKELDFSYLESLIETGENLLDNQTVRVEEGKPSEAAVKELTECYHSVSLDELTSEEIRQGMQLAILKGTKEDYLQPNHQMTPDSIGSLMAYLIEVIASPKNKGLHLADLSVGTGNLLFTVYHFLRQNDREMTLSGVENDELLISLAATNAALQEVTLQLTHQDALQNLLLDPVDIMVSDLPVGYYPIDENAKRFESSFKEGHSFSHYLLIEQALNYLKDGGFGFFLVPSQLFDAQEARGLLTHIQKIGHFQGFIQLPKELFRNEQSRKAILVLQKQGEDTKQAKEVLLANAPEFKDAESMKEFIVEINQWKESQL
jgi:site-specific DNA-methyltransferase (adenine-specific)